MHDTLALWDWRRRVAALYAEARAGGAAPDAWSRWLDGRRALFAAHPQTPLETPAPGLPASFPHDPALRFAVRLRPVSAERLSLPAGADGEVALEAFARTEGLAAPLGGELTLWWIGGYGGGVFLPFADATSGRETYGAGRYLLDTIKGADLGHEADGRLVLDFNYAYFPSCAYSPRFVCPLAPDANRLPMPVRAGERLDRR